MPLPPLATSAPGAGAGAGPGAGAGADNGSLLSPVAYDDDAASLHSRSDQDTDSEDDELQLRARNSRELRAADRIVLMEEEEREELVENTRRRMDGERRGSGLAIPNPLAIFGRKGSGGGGGGNSSPSRERRANALEEDVSEKRKSRRERRKEKKERLMEHAEHGEDGELMYELEEGDLKEGSSTGDSSGREDSDEVDRRYLNAMAQAKADRKRSWRRGCLIYSLIVVGFIILLLIAWKLSLGKKGRHAQQLLSNGTALFGPTTIIISLDGFRADFLQRGLTPTLNAFIKEGVSPKYMLPSFPSVTFPNHYTLATGLYPESHGIVGNTFWDPDLQAEFYYTDPNRSMDPKWWMGEPFWVTAEKQGIRTAIHMWPGSEAHIMGVEPSFLDEYNGGEKLPKKVDRVFDFLDRPGLENKSVEEKDTRPQLIALYVPNVDGDGHKYGPNSTEIRSTIQNADDMLHHIFQGLEDRNLTNIVNVIVVSDHGMATTDTSRLIQLEDLVDVDKIAHKDGWPLVGLRPKNPDDLDGLYRQIINNTKDNPNVEVYLRDVDMPERYHFSNNDRIAPLWIVPKTGWGVVDKSEVNVAEALANGDVYHPRGLHGYDHEHPLMRAIFVARGPAFPHPPNSQMDNFQNIEVYNILCDSIGMTPMPNNGTLRLPLKPLGIHKPEDTPKEPADPEATPSPPPSHAENPDATNAVGVDPVTISQPTDSAPSSAPAPSTGESSGDTTEDEDDKEIEDQEKGILGFWDWFKGKVGDAWDKLTGSSSS